MLLLIVFTGCSNPQNSDRPNGDDIMGDVCITEIEWCGTEWEQIQFPIDLNEDVLEEIKTIETDRSAIEVAAAIIEKLHEKKRIFRLYIDFSYSFDGRRCVAFRIFN